jgi:GTP pyrophosphokinase
MLILRISQKLLKHLDTEELICIKGRPKSIYSIRRKMRLKNVSFDEVYDKFAESFTNQTHTKKVSAGKIYLCYRPL